MKTTLPASVALALSLPLSASRSAQADPPAHTQAAPTLADAVRKDPRFSTLSAALGAADLFPALEGAGPLTVFAPTDEAFARLPHGAVEGLLQPARRGELIQVLTFHVVSGRVRAADLLPRASVETLAGPALGLGLTVGAARVIEADLPCANGVIHVIDGVLLPPKPEPVAATAPNPQPQAATPGLVATEVVSEAIERGAPVYNRGDPAGCAAIYAEAARRLKAAPHALGEIHALEIDEALAEGRAGADAQAWALRHAFDRLLADDAFTPRVEAALPTGFPGPGPVGRVVEKTYPAYRAARAAGGEGAFWTLFQHIQRNEVKMTAPVEMTLDARMRSTDMAFLYERPGQGAPGAQGRVEVLDLPAVTVVSVGLRGDRTEARMGLARRVLEERLAKDGRVAAGPYRTLGYNSPMVPSAQRFWELQVPVRAR